MSADLAALAARFASALHTEGVPVGADRAGRFARAITLVEPATTRSLYWCGLATLIADPTQVDAYDRVFQAIFGGLTDPAQWRGQGRDDEALAGRRASAVTGPVGQPAGEPPPAGEPQPAGPPAPAPLLAVAHERLSTRDFAELTAEELAQLASAMRRLALATPPRRTRRYRRARRGSAVDFRLALRLARRTGGFPVRMALRRPRERPRRLVVLCDISGSMEPYARAMLQLLYCAAGGAGAEVFTFATRLTRLTRVLRRVRPGVALQRAGRTAPDWAGGTRIGASLRDFNDRYGVRGLARGAVVLIVSDGWETGDAAELGRQMARLSRVAYRIVWCNPRTASPRYEPKVAGMAAAWRHCDEIVSGHHLAALDPLLAALSRAR